MDKSTTITTVRTNLGITDTSRDLLIGDIWTNAVTYMNLAELPDALEPFVRAKVSNVINYETQFGSGNVMNVSSQTEGKCSWTFNITDDTCRESIYGFSTKDFQQLRRFRVTRK